MSDHEAPEEYIPEAVQSELAILAHLLVTGADLVRIADVLQPDDFYRKANAYIFDAIVRMHRAEIPVDLVTVSNFLDDVGRLEAVGGRRSVSELALDGYPAGANLEYHAELVKDASVLRQWRKAVSKPPEDLDELRAQHKALSGLAETSTRHTSRRLQDVLPDEFCAIAERADPNYESRALHCGHADVDSLTNGFAPKDLIVIAGRPSMGKTSFAQHLAASISVVLKKATAIFSLEMPQEQIRQKFLAMASGVATNEIRAPHHFDQSHYDKINKALATFNDAAAIHIVDSGVRTVMDIEAQISRMNPTPEIVFIDHLRFLSGLGRTENRDQEVGEITKDLKNLAKKLDIPIVLLCQLNRGVEARTDKRPMMSDLRESGNVEQDADMIMFLYREEYYKPDTDKRGECEIILAKNRLGETGMATLSFRRSTGKFFDRKGEETAPPDNVTPIKSKYKLAGAYAGHPYRDD